MNNPRRIQRHLVKALAAGAVLVAAALPMAIATAASAAGDAITTVSFAPSPGSTTGAYFGTGASGTFTLGGTFAGDGGNATVTSNAPGLTFTGVTDTTSGGVTSVSGHFASTSATVAGTYNIVVTDNAGTTTDSSGVTVDAQPTVSSLSNTTGADTSAATAINTTITGSGFFGTPIVILTSTVDGTKLSALVTPTGVSTAATAVSTLAIAITPTNTVDGAPATPGTYLITVINPDGGTSTSGALFTIVGDEISAVSPSSIALAAATYPITISGAGFGSNPVVTVGGTNCKATYTVSNIVQSGATSISANVTNATVASATGTCDVTVANTSTGGNGSTYTATGALGEGISGLLAPVITTSSLTAGTAVQAGAGVTNITFTGEGFSSFTAPASPSTTIGTSATADTYAVLVSPCIGGSTGTTLTCELNVTSGATAGAHTALLVNGSAVGSLANAFTVAGPSITSIAPTSLSVGAPVGTTIVITGTGFTNTSVVHVGLHAGGVLAGTGQYVSATSMNFVVTTRPNLSDNGDVLTVSTTNSTGGTEVSAPFTLSVGAAPTVNSITYATNTTGVGVGATARTITINGSGFATGATVGSFVNATGVADAAVKATVTSVNSLGTALTATVAITSPDVNTIDGYTVTNTNGGTIVVPAVAPAGLTIDAGPTVTAVSPATAVANTTNAFTITGTGFTTGAVVAASSDGTCGTATVVSSTSITVSCTLGAAGTSAVTLIETNLDGGSATSATVLAAAKPPIVVVSVHFHTTGSHGYAVVGRTATLTISGAGFYGQPRITSNEAGTRAVVSHDNGKLLTVRVTVKAGSRTGEHTFTIRLANGKSAKANYAVKK